jgi:hypothetical protein
MTLIDDFKTKYPKYWSVWCSAAAVLLSVLELLDLLGMLMPAFENVLPTGSFVAGSIFFTLCGMVARAIKQSNLNPVDPTEVSDAPAK